MEPAETRVRSKPCACFNSISPLVFHSGYRPYGLISACFFNLQSCKVIHFLRSSLTFQVFIVSAVVGFTFADLISTNTNPPPIVHNIVPKTPPIESSQHRTTTSIIGSSSLIQAQGDLVISQLNRGDRIESWESGQDSTNSGQAMLVGRIRVRRSQQKDTTK